MVDTPTPPIPIPEVVPTTVEETLSSVISDAKTSDLLKDGVKTVGAGLGALGIWSMVYRTAAEAISIAFSSFLIGYTSGAVGSFLLAVAGGLLVGLAVGLVVKRSWLVMISAPLGTLLGMAAAYFVHSMLPEIPWSPILAAVGGSLFALLGGHRRTREGIAKWYERIRPILGMGGGFIFALLGYLLGSILHL